MKLLSSVLLLALFMSGCETPVHVKTNTTAFYVKDYKNAGTIAVVPAAPELNNSLEFAHYKSLIEEKLKVNGYTIEGKPTEAEYVAAVSYGIDDGKNAVISSPIFGQTGGGTTYSSGTVGTSVYQGSSYTMPLYGVVGATSETVTKYNRVIALDIVKADSIKEGHPIKVFESRAKSTGGCNVIAGVFEEMLEAMFYEFPGQNGKTFTLYVQMKGSC